MPQRENSSRYEKSRKKVKLNPDLSSLIYYLSVLYLKLKQFILLAGAG